MAFDAMDAIKYEKNRLLTEAESMVNRIEREGRSPRPDEKEQIGLLLRSAAEKQDRIDGRAVADFYQTKRENEEIRQMMERIVGPGTGGGQLGDVLAKSGWHPREKPSVTLPLSTVGLKVTVPSAELWSPTGPEVRPTALDARWLFMNLRQRDAGSSTAIADFRETAQSVTGNVERELDSVSDKAVLDLTLTSVVAELKMFALLIESIPSAIFESVDGIQAFFNNRATYEIRKAIDAHLIAAILAANPPNSTAGANMIEEVRNAVSLARSNGANPTLLAIDPTDGAALDLSVTGTDNAYVFPLRDSGSASPLWGVRVVESPSMVGHDPVLIDADILGPIYLGRLKLESDIFSGFKQNLVRLRIEMTGLAHIRNANGAVIVGTESP